MNTPVRIVLPVTGLGFLGFFASLLLACQPAGPVATITRLAGTGEWTSTGDGGPAVNATIKNPSGLVLDSSGRLLFTDANGQRVRRISALDGSGTVSAFAGTGSLGFSGDAGAAAAAQFNYPLGIAVDSLGSVYVADSDNNRVRVVAANGTISTFAGDGVPRFLGDTGQASAASLNHPTGLAFDSLGNLYIADNGNNRIRKVTTGGVITTFAGTGTDGNAGDEGPAISAQLSGPWAVAIDTTGNVYIADTGSNKIRKVDAGGTMHTVAGTGAIGSSGDGGAATSAELKSPKGVAVDSAGRVYLADYGNYCVREIDTDGTIKTVAGTCGIEATAPVPGGTGATSTALWKPISVLLDGDGILLIADEQAQSIFKVTSQ